MVGLGKYAATVLGAYAVTILLLAVLVIATLRRGRVMRERLEAQERRMARHG
ncbi:MAG: heme exporter protein CcmD [Defluviimonas sp.]|uniref:heme exporter protein CcmD n=1 Tax=Albidovulum sp. TaxID=1872424 RepID=UPI001D3EFDFD|nr:heme exporter protein CcmD [Paracoccaceae bacterium]MCC0064114.1 heme exporter protein CcmD [Defluviimonas sp.]